MNVALRRPMTQAEFFDWAETQRDRYEFDGTQPVAMTGGNLGHNQITLAIHRALERRLGGRSCRPLGPDAGVATVGTSIRYPDAVVTCSPFSRTDLTIPEPIVVFEVISPSSITLDRVEKLEEYREVSSIRVYVVVESEAPAVTVFWREDSTASFKATGLTAKDTLDLPDINVSIPVSEFFADIDFDTKPA